MKITVEDRAPGSGVERTAHLEDRTRRVLGRMSERIASITIQLASDGQQAGHRRVHMAVLTTHGERIEASVQRRLLPDALADAFDALVTRIALSGISSTHSDDGVAFLRQPTPSTTGRPRL